MFKSYGDLKIFIFKHFYILSGTFTHVHNILIICGMRWDFGVDVQEFDHLSAFKHNYTTGGFHKLFRTISLFAL